MGSDSATTGPAKLGRPSGLAAAEHTAPRGRGRPSGPAGARHTPPPRGQERAVATWNSSPADPARCGDSCEKRYSPVATSCADSPNRAAKKRRSANAACMRACVLLQELRRGAASRLRTVAGACEHTFNVHVCTAASARKQSNHCRVARPCNLAAALPWSYSGSALMATGAGSAVLRDSDVSM
jgi:hypothetical protein